MLIYGFDCLSTYVRDVLESIELILEKFWKKLENLSVISAFNKWNEDYSEIFNREKKNFENGICEYELSTFYFSLDECKWNNYNGIFIIKENLKHDAEEYIIIH